jgi:3-phosphoshikimate 1-carboxyvinyltransferase
MLTIKAPKSEIKYAIKLSGSKSISNRLLILNEALAFNLSLENISDSEDTLLLKQALLQIKNKSHSIIDIHHAGTDMRFLTAYLATKPSEWVLTGSERMKQRPIAELVTALKTLGADINYLEKEGFPPLKINGKKLRGGNIQVDGSISSQFISALLLIAPIFEDGLELTLKNQIVSWPYIKMTLDILSKCGIEVKHSDNIITILNSSLITHHASRITHQSFVVESDWSSASYWYSICALSKNAVIELSYLTPNSLQADSVLPQLYNQLGVETTFKETSIVLSNKQTSIQEFSYDFINCPDIAQTIAVTCFGLGIKATLTGLKTLKVKETDRIVALKNELEKFGATVDITDDSINIKDTRHKMQDTRYENQGTEYIETYNDHRMAMSFAPLALIYNNISIQHPEVVTKSYPRFWEDLKSVGFSVNSHSK